MSTKKAPGGARMNLRCKDSAIKRLKQLYFVEHYKKYPSIPQECRFAPAYTDRTANGLTKCITQWLKLSGWQAERINTMGRPVDGTRVVTDCIGRQRRIGSVRWIHAGTTRGSADISATIAGRSVKIEVKAGKDRQSESQCTYQADIERSGGVYIIARTFEGFLGWYDEFIKKVA